MSETIRQLSGDPHDLIAGFALDALDPEEARRFTEHLPACPPCREELKVLSAAATDYGSSTRVAPPAALETTLMTALFGPGEPSDADEQTVAPIVDMRSHRRWLWPVAAAAAFILGAGLVAGGVSLTRTDDTQEVVAESQHIADIAGAPDTHFMPLDTLDGSVKLMVSDQMNAAAVLATDLPMPEDGMKYRVWTIMADGSMMPAATFLPDSTGRASAVLDADVHDAAGFMLTVDSADASHPTGDALAEVHI